MTTTDELIAQAQQLSQGALQRLMSKLVVAQQRAQSTLGDLTYKQRRFVQEYTAHGNAAKARREVGCMSHPLAKASVREAAEARMAELEVQSELKAEYVRQYIHSALELCPTDYFFIAEDGGWAIDPDKFALLPKEVRRLVDKVEVRTTPRGAIHYSVCFISKTAALAMAAKYTLPQKIEADVKHSGLPWERLVAGAESEAEDPVEKRIAALESYGRNGRV